MQDFDDVQNQIDEMLASIKAVHGKEAQEIAGIIAQNLYRQTLLVRSLGRNLKNSTNNEKAMNFIWKLSEHYSHEIFRCASLMFKGAGISKELGDEITEYAFQVAQKAANN